MKITVTVPQISDSTDASYTLKVDRHEAIKLGAKRLGASMVGRNYYYLAEETNEVFRLTATEVAMLGAGEIDERGCDYSLWCSVTGWRMQRPRANIKAALGIE